MHLTIESLILSGTSNEIDWTVDLEKVPEELRVPLLCGLAQQGAKIIFDRVKSGKPKAERQQHVAIVQKAMQDGSYGFGTGRTMGPRDYRGKAEIEVLADWRQTELRDDTTGKTVPRKKATDWAKDTQAAWLEISRQYVIAMCQEQEMSEDDIKALDLDAIAGDAENLEFVKSQFEEAIKDKARKLEEADKKTAGPSKKDTSGIKLPSKRK